MNAFIKYKNYLRGLKQKTKKKAETEEFIYNLLNKANDDLKRANPLLVKKAEKEALKIFEKHGIEMSGFDEKEFKKSLEMRLHRANGYQRSYTMYGELIASFDNEKAIREVDLLSLFVTLIISSCFIDHELNTKEISIILGSAIHYIHKKQKNPNEWLSNLSKFYNPDGSFKFDDDFELLKNSLYSMANDIVFDNTHRIKLFIVEDKEKSFKDMTFALIDSIVAFYIASKFEAKISASKPDEEKKVILPKHNYELQKFVNQYYKDGEIIAIPDDIENFISSLVQLGYADEEIKAIQKKINKMLALDDYSGLLNIEDLQVINTATEFLNSLKPYDERYLRIISFLKDIDALKELYKEADASEQEELIVEKVAIITELQMALEELMPEKAAITNNLVFLPDKSNNSYFYTDLSDMETNLRKEAVGLLDRINSLNTSNFRPVKGDNIKSNEVFEVYNKKLHVIFKVLGNNTYLVLGVAKKGDYYMINRLTSKANKEYLDSLSEALKSDVDKEKLLAENQIMREGFKEAVARKRKKD